MLMKKWMRGMACRSLLSMVVVTLIFGSFTSVMAAEWAQTPSFLSLPDVLSLSDGDEAYGSQPVASAPLFYMPDIYETHRLTGYSAVALTILAMVSGDDSALHKLSGAAAAAFGVAAGATGHTAYGAGIDFNEGWTRENIHAGSGYLATAALVMTAVLGVADTGHSGVGGVATAAVVVPVLVFAF